MEQGNKPVVLLVDDSPDNLMVVSEILKKYYRVKIATDGKKALQIAAASPPDIILLDVVMPVLDGYETCTLLKADPILKDIPVIFLTAKNEVDNESHGLELGAVDYIVKPISPSILLSRIKTHLTLKQSRDFLSDKNQFLEAEIIRRTKEISAIQQLSILSIAALAETRDDDTGAHIQRTKLYVKELAEYLATFPAYQRVLTPKNIDMLVTSAPLHDIGKVGIPDSILLKPGMLTAEEFEIMKTHTTIGRNALYSAEQQMYATDEFLKYGREISYSHHERWNGSGYPQGLSGEDIPLSARLMALADVYDALTTRRVYKDAMAHETAASIIIAERGKHFDPAIVDAFIALQDRFSAISHKYADAIPPHLVPTK